MDAVCHSLVIGGGDAADETQEIISFDRTDALSIVELGLTLEEAKSALVALQIAITDAQVDDLFEPIGAGDVRLHGKAGSEQDVVVGAHLVPTLDPTKTD
ncbi:hypothetical protein EOA32_33225 [Mesorhizobium sp. M1A.F.Ca.ET.072.01.1.1]|uniref:hypothetical protein n=1 Tax=Mesorhizobium sp. M1A.F.Ca.ET.072.01.1.1 TaxID=2496753 RepID=UPI000FD1F1F1|nr:hypothetical protein [Mesorhizobium sp. M1A.F.Ca.ET.072.01.1.1]RUW45797.1 hypothetical protein EOA32_33225 [Mesorhizobium sp. M1A.F.Ca.ET.072.01.1.1]TIU96970.1 MAG: hypothetical protein E5W04_27245 [Mesorhizobium sp.]